MKTLLVGALAASVLVAVAVAVASLWQTPTYEASAKVLLDVQEQDGYGRIHPIPNAPTHDRLRELIQTMAIVIDTHPVAEEAIRRLGLEVSPDELLNNLTIEPAAHTQFVRLSYTDTDLMRAAKVVNTVARVAAERITGTGSESEKPLLNTELTATVWERATLPDAPASPKPLRNGLIAFVAGLAISSAALFAVRRGWFRLDWPG